MEGKNPRIDVSKVSSRSRRESSKPRHHPRRRQPIRYQPVFKSIELCDGFTRL